MKKKTSLHFKKHITSLFLCMTIFLLFSRTALAKETEFAVTDMSATGTISASTLNVRSGPGKDYDLLGKVSSTDTILVTGQASSGWYQIDYNGKEGYISDSYVTITTEESPSSDFSEYIEGDSQKDPLNYLLLIVIAIIIVVIIAIIITTAKAMRKSDAEEEDDEYSDEEEPSPEEEPDEHPNYDKRITNTPPRETSTIVKEDDYRIYIDPIYFKDDTTTSPPTVSSSDADHELEDAISKLNELQQEIERLKDKRK